MALVLREPDWAENRGSLEKARKQVQQLATEQYVQQNSDLVATGRLAGGGARQWVTQASAMNQLPRHAVELRH